MKVNVVRRKHVGTSLKKIINACRSISLVVVAIKIITFRLKSVTHRVLNILVIVVFFLNNFTKMKTVFLMNLTVRFVICAPCRKRCLL